MKRIPLFLSLVLILVLNSFSQKPTLFCSDTTFVANNTISKPNKVCECKVNLQAKALLENSTFCIDSFLSWQVFIDLWGDGGIELEFSSKLPASDTSFLTDSNGNGIPDRYIPKTKSGELIFLPEFNLEAEFSTHKITWKVTNSCGEFTNCSSVFRIIDNIPPTPKGPPLDSIPSKAITYSSEILAISFDRGSTDNCTPNDNLLFTFNNEKPVWNLVNQEHYFKGNGELSNASLYSIGKAQSWIPSKRSSMIDPNCEMIYCSSPFNHIVSVYDQNGNASSFETKVNYIDHIQSCEPDWIYFTLQNLSGNLFTVKNLKFKFKSTNFEINYHYGFDDLYRLMNHR